MTDVVWRVLDEVSALVVVLDYEGAILWWNRAYGDLTGFDKLSNERSHFTELVAREDRPKVVRAFEQLRADATATFDYPLETATGEQRWVTWSNRVIDEGDARIIISTGIDRTMEQAASRALRDSEQRLRELMSASGDAIVWFDERRRIIFYNHAAEAMWGLCAREVIGKRLEILIPEPRRAEAERALRFFARSEKRSLHIGADQDVHGRRRDGSEFYGDTSLVKAPADGGWVFMLAVRDITARKYTEHEQRFFADTGRVLSTLRERDEILSAVASLAVKTVADCCVIDVVGAEGIARSCVAHRAPEQAWLAAALRAVHIAHDGPHPICEAIASRRPLVRGAVDDDFLVRVAQNAPHLELLRALAPRSLLVIPFFAREQLLGAVLLFSETKDRYGEASLPFAEEIARRIGLALENAHLYRALEKAIRARDDVLGIVAHDLKSPLSAVQMAARGLEAFSSDDARAQRLIEVIESSSRRMTSLIGDLLDIASMEAGQLRLKRRTMDARAVLQEALVGVAALADEAGVELRVRQPSEPVTLRADRLRCGQILSNLLSNAVKFTPRGGRVDVVLERHRQHAIFVVRDTGPGLAPEAKKRLFEPFWQRRRSTGEGAGLGLAIARGLVLAHGGDIGVEAEIGKGSSFWFRLPLGAAYRADEMQGITPLRPRRP